MQLFKNVWIRHDNINNSKEELNSIMKILKSLEKTDLLTKDISETIQNEGEKQKDFLRFLYGTLGASLLENLLTGKGVKRPKFSNIPSRGVIR